MRPKTIAAIAPILFLMSLITACQKKQQAPATASAPPPTMPIIHIQADSHTGYQLYPATIEGIENIEIRAKVGGYVRSIYVDEGQLVKKGQRLFGLETETLTQDADAAKAAIKTAEAGVSNAQLEVDRLRPLVEKDVISKVQLSTAEANLAAAESQLMEVKSRYQSIKTNIGYAQLTSPVTGIVGDILLRQGSLVGPSTAQPLTTVSNVDQVYVYFSLSESEYIKLFRTTSKETIHQQLEQFNKVELLLADGQPFKQIGKIDAIAGQINPMTGALRLRAIFDNPDRLLRHGASGTIRLPTSYADEIAIPAMSTFEQQGKTMVYLVGPGDTLRSKTIEIGARLDNIYVVKRGLDIGDKILALGANKVRGGDVIRPQQVTVDSVIHSFQAIF